MSATAEARKEIRANIKELRALLREIETATREGRWSDVADLANEASCTAIDCGTSARGVTA